MTVRLGEGRPDAPIFIVGEVWGPREVERNTPFAGASGQELNSQLHDAGLMRSDCYVTNVVNAMPPGGKIESWIPSSRKDITPDMVSLHDKIVKPIVREGVESLAREITLVEPRVIVALGNTALWALTGHSGIIKWRGSLLDTTELVSPGEVLRVVPTFHPAAVLRMMDWRPIAVQDLRRAARELTDPAPPPIEEFILHPSFPKVIEVLDYLIEKVETDNWWIDLDLETKAGHIACCGLTWSRSEAICIPFMCESDRAGYWLLEEETEIVWRLRRLLTHPRCWVRGQNILYDAQYTYRHWGFVPNVRQDTMISQHTLWAGMRKSLDFQASMYCGWYVQWKPDKASWKEGG